ncbi:unnamed protein product [Haemonchus placei]|uniref:G_PROTEIN_RECEP_F1_2 domain-containing protein n=1 Tax=Haemonchus placei TaxID=6290 RepID=A0A0N4W384_HAEPC|nr:unnamed protein product [Haemonchus placei]
MIADPVHNNTCTFYEWSRNPHHAKFFRIFSIISVLTVLVVVVVLGNALVIAAVLLRRRLRSATGLLILSLGVADLLVGTVILPFSIANEVLSGYWIFGETWCTIWLTMDIWMCTASIYNLVAISIDRYIAIIKPLNYPMLVTKFRARCTVAIVWIGSFIICSPSFFLASSIKDINQEPCKCTPANAGRVYITFSASSSFYVPMIIVIFVYFRIYIAARAATKSIYSGMMQVTANANRSTKIAKIIPSFSFSDRGTVDQRQSGTANETAPQPTKSPLMAKLRKNPLRKLMNRGHAKKSSGAYEKRLSLEIKAAKTVAIVTGCFIFCWLGFSLLYGLELQTNDVVWSVLFWLGYLNSALNPVIYTVFNREFRTCFKWLLTSVEEKTVKTSKERKVYIE